MGIIFDTREGYVASLSMLGIVFNTREGCVASLSMLGIIFDTREEGEGARKKANG